MAGSYHKTVRFQNCIIRQRARTFQVEMNVHGRRERTAFKTLAAAKTHIRQLNSKLKSEGVVAFSLTTTQTLDATEAIKHLGDAATLKEAAAFWLKHNRPLGGKMMIEDLLKPYLDHKRGLNRRSSTIGELVYKVGALVEFFKGREIHTITSEDMEKWLAKNNSSPRHRNKCKRLAHAFFRFAQKRRLIETNPTEGIESATVERKPPEIYSLAESEKILRAAEEKYPAMVAHLAIALFAGLRPQELMLLDWADILFDQRAIRVRAEIAKNRTARDVDMSDNLIEWLRPLRSERGPVSLNDADWRKQRDAIVKMAEVNRWIHDGLRHTFASFHVALHQSAERTAYQLGHRSTDLLYNHYRNLVAKQDAEKFWSIRPLPKT